MMKSIARSLLDKLGVEIRRTRAGATGFPASPYAVQQKLLWETGRRHPVIFDVGAHKGETVARYRGLFPDVDIWGFEAFPDSIRVLQQRFANDASVHIVPAAVTDRSGQKTFYVNANDSTHSLLPRNQGSRRYYHSSADAVSAMEVAATTLDDVIKDNRIDLVDILKLDIQGSELMAFDGAKETLEANRVSLIYTETLFVPHYQNNPLFYELWTRLAEYGYTLFNLYDLYHARNGQLRFADALFVSPQMRRDVIDRFADEP